MGNPFSAGSQSNQGLANFGQMASKGGGGGGGAAAGGSSNGVQGLTQLFQQLMQKQQDKGPGLYSPMDKQVATSPEQATMMNFMPAIPYIPTGQGQPQNY